MSRLIIRKSVDLPAPDRPITPTIIGRSKSSVTRIHGGVAAETLRQLPDAWHLSPSAGALTQGREETAARRFLQSFRD